MGLYASQIFPRLMDWAMSGDEFQQLRRLLLQSVGGEVLEIGLGTGLNLPHYPGAVSCLHAVDPVQLLPDRVTQRSQSVAFPIRLKWMSAETLPFDDRTFDSVISTWTLCTISDPVKAVREIRRVLKPDGTFLFLEHGRSEDARTAAWQDRLNSLQQIIGCGCNLNRKIDQIIAQAGLKVMTLDRFQLQSVPRLGGEMYRGTATRPD
jgi:ubiquinone/menaquinone biosynthesis C-methylase UbiE